ncbi:MAG: radical SAM family heme chaperone HemW [Actinomycetota bacterium]
MTLTGEVFHQHEDRPRPRGKLRARCDGEWRAEPGFGVYVHIPFCLHRCHYCDFNTYEGQDDLHDGYVDALVRAIETTEGSFPEATSVFFGGGTPTLLAPPQLGRILTAVRNLSGIAPDAEVTVEANPETVDTERFAGLLEAGFNRVSIGVQSLVPHVLKGLGRTHTPERALAAIAAARQAGVPDVNADLIYGSAWESDDDWIASLNGVMEAEPDHVSAYALTIESGTPLATLVGTGRVRDVDPDVQATRHGVADEMLNAAGYERYEISNWARPGRASTHNVLYWSAGDYLGFGAGAHGHLAGLRYWSVRLPRDFIARVTGGGSPEQGREVVEDRMGEALMLGLRLTSGIDVAALRRRFGPPGPHRRATIGELEARGALEQRDGNLRLTDQATLLANDVISRLL